jgi:hypothetical protein
MIEKIVSHHTAYIAALDLVSGMEIGDMVAPNAILIEKTDRYEVKISGSSYNYDTRQEEVTMTTCEMADFVLYPERRRFNDALDVLNRLL